MHLRFVISLIVAALSTPAIFAQGTNQPTVDELVAKNIEAKGGATALDNLRTLRSTGKLLVPVQGVIELGYLQTKKRPDNVRTEASLQGMTQIEAYDGKDGWKVSPFFGRKDPERMAAVLGTLVVAVRKLAEAIAPVIPTAVAKLLEAIDAGADGSPIGQPVPLFPRLELLEDEDAAA